MVESILKRAKGFFGLEEDEDLGGRQMDMGSLINEKKVERPKGDFEIVVYEPKVYEDSLSISTQLRNRKPVVINLRHLEPSEGTRLIDFVCGTAYAIDGHMLKIGENLFIFVPSNVLLTNAEERPSLSSELEIDENKKETFFSNR